MRPALLICLLVLAQVMCKSPRSNNDGKQPTKPHSAPSTASPGADVRANADEVSTASPAWNDEEDPSPAEATPPANKDKGDQTNQRPRGDRVIAVDEPLRGRRSATEPVYVVRGDDPTTLVRRIFDMVDPAIPADARVVLLLNIGGFDRLRRGPDNGFDGRTTSRGVVRALIAELRRRGHRDLVLAGGASRDQDEWQRILQRTGTRAFADELRVPLVDLNHYGEGDDRPAARPIVAPWAKHLKTGLELSDALFPHDRPLFLIDVPKLKTHRFAVMTLSMKNLMGAVQINDGAGAKTPPYRRRWRMHRELGRWLKAWKQRGHDDRARYRLALQTFSERLTDLYGILTPDLVILDGMPAMQGDGFSDVVAYDSLLIASKNGCYADYVAAERFGLHDSDELEAEIGYRMPPAIAHCLERYYGGTERARSIEVRGDTGWRTGDNRAWYKAMAPFEIARRPTAPPAAD